MDELPVITAEATVVPANLIIATVGLYTSRPEIESIYSSLGVALRVDDNEDEIINAAELGYLEDVCEEATDEINVWLLPLYAAHDLAGNRWIRRRASWLACCILSRRRGNAAQFTEMCEKAMQDIKDVVACLIAIPGISPIITVGGPRMSNQRVDYRYCDSALRTDPLTSTFGGASVYKDYR